MGIPSKFSSLSRHKDPRATNPVRLLATLNMISILELCALHTFVRSVTLWRGVSGDEVRLRVIDVP